MENTNKERDTLIQQTLNARNHIWELQKAIEEQMPLLSLDIEDREPFVAIANTIYKLNGLLDKYEVQYELGLIEPQVYQAMSEEDKLAYINKLDKNPERLRFMGSHLLSEVKTTANYLESKSYTCPHCNNSEMYNKGYNYIELGNYSMPADAENEWHEDHFCKHCGNLFTITNEF